MKKTLWTRQRVFFIWSAILTFSGVWSVFVDFNPPWRGYQKDFEKVTLKLAQEEIDRENAKVEALYKKRIEEIDSKIRDLSDKTRNLNQQKVVESKEKEVAELVQKEYEAGQKLSFAKSELGAWRSKYEFLRNDAYARPDEVNESKTKYEHYFKEVLDHTPSADVAYAALTKGKEELKELQKGPADAVRQKQQILAERDGWKAEIEKINPSDIVQFTARQARDIPLLDFLDPKYTLKQVVMDDFPDLTKSEKVDRCQTCHLGVADTRYSRGDVPAVFRTHPRLDLFVGSDSPHPVEKFGCTSCHMGRGYGTTFYSAAHTANDEEQAKEWEHKYGWKDMHYWDYPMLPRKNVQASCFSCHKQTLGYELTMARQVYEGRLIYERRGCHGCHKIEGVSNDMKKIGPTLTHVSSKLDADWMHRWISGPREFYPTARMPHPFGHRIPNETNFPDYLHHLEHATEKKHFEEVKNSFGEQAKRIESDEAVMIDSIVAYLADKTTALELDEPPAEPGDVAKGKVIVGTHNCLGCHKVDDFPPKDGEPPPTYGPDLSKVGSKTNRKWLYNWIRNPKKYWPDGNMPNPRLSDAEANDATAYLLSLKDDAYMAKPTVAPTNVALEDLAIRFTRAKMSEADAKAKVAKLDEHGRKLLVGEEAIYRNGCFGCHDINGFEGRQRIGAELTAEGVKELELFDFGMHKYVHIPHTRHDWIDQKVRQPYVYFLGKVVNPYEQELRMPWFGFSKEDAQRITTFVLGQAQKFAPDKYKFNPVGEKLAVLEGRKILERKNCVGCHRIGTGEQFVDVGKFDFSSHLVWVKDPLIAKFDPNLPEGSFARVDQVKEPTKDKEGKITDKVILPKNAWISGETILGKDKKGDPAYLSVPNEILGKDSVQVNVGSSEVKNVALDRPKELKVLGVDEGRISQYYEMAALAPPVLRNEGAKVRPEWFFKFLKNVTPIRNHIEVRMPQWEWTDDEATAVVRYFSAAAQVPFPYETEHVPPIAEDPNDPVRKTVKEIFGLPGSPEYDKSLQCFSCHPAGELTPTSQKENWGPNLYLAHDRLKNSFIESWLRNPQAWAPGAKMPSYFYEIDGGNLKPLPPASPSIGALGEGAKGGEEAITRLTNMLYRLPELKEVDVAAKAEVERRKTAPKPGAPGAAPNAKPFDDGDGAPAATQTPSTPAAPKPFED